MNHSREYLTSLYDALWTSLGQIQASGQGTASYFPDDLEDDPNDPYDYHANVGLGRLFLDIHNRMGAFLEPNWDTTIGFAGIRSHFEPMSHQAFIERLSLDPSAPPQSFYPKVENTTEIKIADWAL